MDAKSIRFCNCVAANVHTRLRTQPKVLHVLEDMKLKFYRRSIKLQPFEVSQLQPPREGAQFIRKRV